MYFVVNTLLGKTCEYNYGLSNRCYNRVSMICLTLVAIVFYLKSYRNHNASHVVNNTAIPTAMICVLEETIKSLQA